MLKWLFFLRREHIATTSSHLKYASTQAITIECNQIKSNRITHHWVLLGLLRLVGPWPINYAEILWAVWSLCLGRWRRKRRKKGKRKESLRRPAAIGTGWTERRRHWRRVGSGSWKRRCFTSYNATTTNPSAKANKLVTINRRSTRNS